MTLDNESRIYVLGQAHIPIRNLWLLLLYASDFYTYGTERSQGFEENPELLADLLASILCHSVEERLIRPLTPAFMLRKQDLRRVRGRIDVLRTTTHQLLTRGQVACRFEALTVDTPRNRLVRAGLMHLAALVTDRKLGHRCRSQARKLADLGVARVDSRSALEGVTSQFARNDAKDRSIVSAAKLALQLVLPRDNEAGGVGRAAISEQEFRRLFERAIGGFYKVAGGRSGWKTTTGRYISWHKESETPGIQSLLPKMQTDIILENGAIRRRLIIDTKFTSSLEIRRHGGESFKSSHLYQVYTYVRTQESPDDPLSLSSEGMLLYPSVGTSVLESFTSGGHKFTLATIDLGASALEIREQLLSFLER
ncbi:5-methylcytosine restriction system specificity protein McrC [Paenarthrobacter nitroguajacolicus]|uniref:5-methylcytosine restriction system specificity protein McrC n=1 Tax=Paenarthrobacter nitroguajacolicus TaxID=211146 RepID=UPI00341EDACF